MTHALKETTSSLILPTISHIFNLPSIMRPNLFFLWKLFSLTEKQITLL